MSIKRIEFDYALSKVVSGAIIEYVKDNHLDQSEIDRLVEEAWQHLKKEAPEALQRERVAVVLDDAISAEHVQQYLPQGYNAKIEYVGEQLHHSRRSLRIVIRGYDIAGWTLNEYVIPRLGSGMIVATEVYATEAFENDED